MASAQPKPICSNDLVRGLVLHVENIPGSAALRISGDHNLSSGFGELELGVREEVGRHRVLVATVVVEHVARMHSVTMINASHDETYACL